MIRVTAVTLLLAFGALLSACRQTYGTVETVSIESEFLGKTMRVSVHLPDDYSPEKTYPVLYFVPYGGGGPGIITHQTSTDKACRAKLTSSTKQLIIVGVPHDGSFLLDSDPPHQELISEKGIRLARGYYESFFLEEVISEVESRYSTDGDYTGRYIGGYSMGGYAALRIGITSPDQFSKVGAHSPTLVVDALPDKTVTEFMYPDEKARAKRDPLLLVKNATIPATTRFLIDTGAADINLAGCQLMFSLLKGKGASVDFQILRGAHGTSYLSEHLPAYLDFYLSE